MRLHVSWLVALGFVLASCGVDAPTTGDDIGQLQSALSFASFDSEYFAPRCPGREVCSTDLLVKYRGYYEQNGGPNTLHGSCTDASGAGTSNDLYIDSLSIEAVDGSSFLEKGETVRARAIAWVPTWAAGTARIALYYTSNVASPTWTLLTEVTATSGGLVVVTANRVLSTGGLHAIRARVRYGGSSGACGTGSLDDDHDDLVFESDLGDVDPPSVTISSPTAGQSVGGSWVLLEAQNSDLSGVTRVEFYVGSTLVATDSTPYPVASVGWDATAWAPGTYVLTAKAWDGAGNMGTSAPVSFQIAPDTTPPTIAITSPANGATVSSKVTFQVSGSDDRGSFNYELLIDGVPSGNWWDSAAAPNGQYEVIARAADEAGNVGTSAPIMLTVSNDPTTASWDATFGAPRCAADGALCHSGTLLEGRGGNEFHAPNSLGGCADESAGVYHVRPSIDAVRISAVDSGPLTVGRPARAEVTVWAESDYWNDVLDLYSADDASAPSWRYLGRVVPTTAGAQTLSLTFTLPEGSDQALRARFRRNGTERACGVDSFVDHDDLVFSVAGGAPDGVPPSVAVSSPADGTIVSGMVTIEAAATDDVHLERVEFLRNGVVFATDSSAPYAAIWDTSMAAAGSHTLTARAIDGAGNVATHAVSVAIVDTTPPTVSLTSPTPGATITGTPTLLATASDDRAVNRVEFFVGTTLIGSDATAPYSVLWNSSTVSNGSQALRATAYDAAGNSTESAAVIVFVSNSAVAWDPTLRVPKCGSVQNRCDSGTLLTGRANLGPEVNAPNTLQDTCADGTSGTFHVDESSDGITVSTLDGTPMAPGKQVRVEVRVWAYSGYTSDRLDIFYTANANSPAWTLLTTLTPTRAGANTLSATYTLPSGTLQAVRASFRYGGSATACPSGGYNDRDDLAFAVGP